MATATCTNQIDAGAGTSRRSRDLGPPTIPFHVSRSTTFATTAASLAISAGANVKAVQRMLGHSSAAMALYTYADLFDDDLDAVAVALDAARTRAQGAVAGSYAAPPD